MRWSDEELKMAVKINFEIFDDDDDRQVFKRALRRGFELVLMVVGQSGLGKSTLVSIIIMIMGTVMVMVMGTVMVMVVMVMVSWSSWWSDSLEWGNQPLL